jgi:hypothetical protein
MTSLQNRTAFAALVITMAGACAGVRDIGTADGAAGAGGSASSGAAGTIGAAGAGGSAGTPGAAGSGGGAGANPGTGGAAGTSAIDAGGLEAAPATGGSTGSADAAPPPPCPGCKVSVLYTCHSDAPDAVNFTFEIVNKGAVVFLLADLTVRYWYTADAGKDQEFMCDFARVTCAGVTSRFQSVEPPRAKANRYVEIGFKQGAVDVNGTTGDILVRLFESTPTRYAPLVQSDDYSFDCSAKSMKKESTRITAYLKGALVGGTEPQ